MKPPAWLAELHRQWFAARGLNLEPSTRPFARDWPELLDAAGLRGAAERNAAEAEARRWEAEGRLRLRTHKYRTYLIEKIAVPVTEESWLVTICGGLPARELRQNGMEIVAAARSRGHPRWPASWDQLCGRLMAIFKEGKNLAPFFWKDPDGVRQLLEVLRGLTEGEWPAGTSIRNASESLGLGSKALEERRGHWESGLALLFDEDCSFESLGLTGGQSLVSLHGPLILHFSNGGSHDARHLRDVYTLSMGDLLRAERASTQAARIFSVENTKTSFRQAAAANRAGDTLIIATSYPNTATKRLLQILPADLPHFHFGDTDASGYAILRSLRETSQRTVSPFLMEWRDRENSPPLSECDRRILPSLLASPLMEDCRESLQAMARSGRKGRFEQEACGAPTQSHWPFWPGDA